VIFGLIVPWLTLPEVKREDLERIPPQLARIVREKPPVVIPPPPPPIVKEEPKKPPEHEQKVPEKKPEPVKEKPKPQPTVAQAREKAAVSGLLAFKDAFADMREAVDVSKLNATGAIARGEGKAATIDRSLLTSKHGERSGGVNVAALSRDVGGVALSGRETTRVEAPPEAVGGKGTHAPKMIDPRARSIEEIRRVFDANKGAIFAIYNRALRQDASLQGKVVLELKIDPDGRVLDCRVVSSELGDDTLVSKIVSRIRLFDFGRKDVGLTTISYPVVFLPT
jgi:protein TonB